LHDSKLLLAISESSLRTERSPGHVISNWRIETAEDEILQALFHGQCRKYAVSGNHECGATTKSGAEMVVAGVETQNQAGDDPCGLKEQQCRNSQMAVSGVIVSCSSQIVVSFVGRFRDFGFGL
jgi:hypothetical protein